MKKVILKKVIQKIITLKKIDKCIVDTDNGKGVLKC